jgi:ribosomal protein L40E
VGENDRYCHQCGIQLRNGVEPQVAVHAKGDPSEYVCSECGAEVSEAATKCPKCGADVSENDAHESISSRMFPITRDVVIIWVLTAIGGFVIGLTGTLERDTPKFILALSVSNAFLLVVGFTVSAGLARSERWSHLCFVALGVWFLGLINVVLLGFSFAQWLASALFVYLMMGVGGALSYLFAGRSLS